MRTLAALLVSAILASAQDGGLTLRVDVPLVTVDVSVTDASGRPITNLTRDDFLVYEDDILQETRNFVSVDVLFNALLLFDCSGSTRAQTAFLTATMGAFINTLRVHDMFAVAQFGSRVALYSDWERREASVLAARPAPVEGCNDTNFYGAIDWATRKVAGIAGRKAVVVYTDGMGAMQMQSILVAGQRASRPVNPGDDAEFQKLLQAARSSGARYYFVAVDTDLNPSRTDSPLVIYTLQQARARMGQLAEATGGRIVFPRSSADVMPMYEAIGKEMGVSYSIGYISTNNTTTDGRFRRISVRVRNPAARVQQSRDGYVAP